MPEMTKKQELMYRFFRGPIRDILRSVDGNSQLGAFILALVTVDYLTYLIKPDRNHNNNNYHYKEALNHFEDINSNYEDDSIKSAIYELRNMLIHAYGSSGKNRNNSFCISHDKEETHLEYKNGDIIAINSTVFISELILVSLLILNNMDEDKCACILSNHFKSSNTQIDNDLKNLNSHSFQSIIKNLHPIYEEIDFMILNNDNNAKLIDKLRDEIFKRYDMANKSISIS